MPPSDHLHLVTSEGFSDYALLDCGAGRKLERFGKVVVDRPEYGLCRRPDRGTDQDGEEPEVRLRPERGEDHGDDHDEYEYEDGESDD